MQSLFTILFLCLGWLGHMANADAGSLTQVTDFGDNSSGTLMYIYVPVNLASDPAVIVAIHYCFGTAELYYEESPYATLAETYGFIVIYPQSPYDGTCWDVSSQAALVHGGGGDSESIVNMVTYTIDTYGADSSKVYVTGSSSGGMMTSVLAAAYPEVFAAGIVYSGVAAGCFVAADGSEDYWNSTCALGDTIDTQQQWVNVVDSMYPDYSGAYPKMQVYHGSVDYYIFPENYNESVKQWTGVFGYDLDSYTLNANFPLDDYYSYTYGESFVGIYAINVGHTVPIQGDQDMIWFGFESSDSSTSTASKASTTAISTSNPTSTTVQVSTTAATTSTSSTATATSSGTVPLYGQCGGTGYTGATTCASGTCTYENDYYSQCL